MNTLLTSSGRTPSNRQGRDRGVTYVELVVAIVLLGIAGLGVLTALRATIIGTALERDHSKAHQWLQSASEVLVNDYEWGSLIECESRSVAEIVDEYNRFLDEAVFDDVIPEGWNKTQLSVSSDPPGVLFGAASGDYSSVCQAGTDRQLVTLRVEDPNNRIIETVQVVKAP